MKSMWIIHRNTIVSTLPEVTTYHNAPGMEDETALGRSSETLMALN